MSTKKPRIEPPWGELDPGIISTVRLLWEAGFRPTDSGDGVSKIGSGMEDVLPMPHVVLSIDPQELITQTDAVVDVLERAGYNIDPLDGWHIEGTYSHGSAFVIAYGPTTNKETS